MTVNHSGACASDASLAAFGDLVATQRRAGCPFGYRPALVRKL